jgi:hypothetical protein
VGRAFIDNVRSEAYNAHNLAAMSSSSDDDDSDAAARVLESLRRLEEGVANPGGHSPEGPPRKKRRQNDPLVSRRMTPDSQFERRRRPTPETVDFEAHRDGRFGQQLLYKFLNEDELSVLVGLATTLSDTNSCDPVGAMIDRRFHHSHPHHLNNNPLLGLANSPLAPSFLNYLSQKSLSVPNFNDEEVFDDSALVAMGVLLEEAITASMLPLARLHVLRCRELEDLAARYKESDSFATEFQVDEPEICRVVDPVTGLVVSEKRNTTKRDSNDADAFEEWNLPPEEALQKILTEREFNNCCLPTALPATRTIDNNVDLTEDLSEGPAKQALLEWCQTQLLVPTFVQHNMDLFQVFVPSVTQTQDRNS